MIKIVTNIFKKVIFIPPLKNIIKLFKNSKVNYSLNVLLIVLVFLCLLEITFRILDFNDVNYFLVKSESSGQVLTFNSNVLSNFYEDFSSIPYNTSSEFAQQKEKNEYRIFLLGEASASGWPYSSKQSIANKIKANLAKKTFNQKINIINISFAGFNSSHAVELVSQILDYNPDLIILYNEHNEFYGYKGIGKISSNSSLALFTFLEDLLPKSEDINTLDYDSNSDDLELLMPIYSDDQIIHCGERSYNSILEQFSDNILKISKMCNENNVELILSVLTDNYLLPPLGVVNLNKQPSADLIFNNARMALLRDGNKSKAFELFSKSKELDAFRIRVPEEFDEEIRRIAANEKILLADLESIFFQLAKDRIPGKDLFVDYFHPNIKGLEVIASTYTGLILQCLQTKFSTDKYYDFSVEPNFDNSKINDEDSLMSKIRIEKIFSLLKNHKFKNNYNSSTSSNYPEDLANIKTNNNVK